MTSSFTTEDALDLISDIAQNCRESGESDMRTIIHSISGIRKMIEQGKSSSEIFDAYLPDDDEDLTDN